MKGTFIWMRTTSVRLSSLNFVKWWAGVCVCVLQAVYSQIRVPYPLIAIYLAFTFLSCNVIVTVTVVAATIAVVAIVVVLFCHCFFALWCLNFNKSNDKFCFFAIEPPQQQWGSMNNSNEKLKPKPKTAENVQIWFQNVTWTKCTRLNRSLARCCSRSRAHTITNTRSTTANP